MLYFMILHEYLKQWRCKTFFLRLYQKQNDVELIVLKLPVLDLLLLESPQLK